MTTVLSSALICAAMTSDPHEQKKPEPDADTDIPHGDPEDDYPHWSEEED